MPVVNGHEYTDHMTCPPSAHTFDAGDKDYEGRLTARGLTICNGCSAVMFYCTADENYHHAGADVPSCFLVPEQSYDVPVPAFAEIPAGMCANTPDGTSHIVARFDGEHYVMRCDDGSGWSPDQVTARPMSGNATCAACAAWPHAPLIPVARCSRGCEWWGDGTETCGECGAPTDPPVMMTSAEFGQWLADNPR